MAENAWLLFLMCTQMSMHEVASRDCISTVTESVPEADPGRKMPWCSRESVPCQKHVRPDGQSAELHPHPCDWEGGKTVGTADEVFQHQCFSCACIIIGVHKGTR